MVYAASRPHVPALDGARIAAISTALALHLIALAILLQPLAYRPPPAAPAAPPEVRWIVRVEPIPIVPVPVPTPTVATPIEPTPTVPTPIAPAQTTPVQMAPIADPAPAVEGGTLPAAPTLSSDTLSAFADSGPAIVALGLIDAPRPRYPIPSLKRGEQGSVLLRVLVGSDGRAREVTIQESSGHRDLDRAAREQVLRRWRFQPAMRDGAATEAIGLVPIDFKLER